MNEKCKVFHSCLEQIRYKVANIQNVQTNAPMLLESVETWEHFWDTLYQDFLWF